MPDFSIVGPLDVPSNGNVLAAGTLADILRRKFVLKKIMATVDAFYSLTDKFCVAKFEVLIVVTTKCYFFKFWCQ
jgi:hypothetical protein